MKPAHRTILLLVLGAAVLPAAGCFVISVQKGYDDARPVAVPQGQLAGVRQVGSEDEVPRFREANAERLARLGPGASAAEFKGEFPGAVFVERRGEVDCYRVDHTERYRYGNSSTVYEVRGGAWFFFRDGKMVKWSERRVWPAG